MLSFQLRGQVNLVIGICKDLSVAGIEVFGGGLKISN